MCRVDLLIIISAFVRPRSLSGSRLPHPAEYALTHSRSRHREVVASAGWVLTMRVYVHVPLGEHTKKRHARDRDESLNGRMDVCRDRERIHLHNLFISRSVEPLSLCIITNFQPSVQGKSAGCLWIFWLC
jgi:hypothetical protein